MPSQSENAKMKRNLEHLVRAVSDSNGGRTKLVGNKAQSMLCECTPIVTAEEISPELRSSAARIHEIRFEKDEVELKHLTALQENPKYLQRFFTAFVQFILNNPEVIDNAANYYKKRLQFYRSEVNDLHGRYLEAAAWIETGFELMLFFIERSEILEADLIDKARSYRTALNEYLQSYLVAQRALTGPLGSLQSMMQSLSILLTNGDAILPESFIAPGIKGRRVNSSPNVIGFYEGDTVYLDTQKISDLVKNYYLKIGKPDFYCSAKEFRSHLRKFGLVDLKKLTSSTILTVAKSVNHGRRNYTPVHKNNFLDMLKEGEICE
jgi:hypothetical protein